MHALSEDTLTILDTPPTDVKVTVICSQDADHPLMFVEWKVNQSACILSCHISLSS